MSERKAVIVAFLQNTWVKASSLPAVRSMYAQHGMTPEGRARVNARLLFYKSLTGRRLIDAFGQQLCDRIIWEESTTEIGTESRAKFPPDEKHIWSALEHFKPGIVIGFGDVAYSALSRIWQGKVDGGQDVSTVWKLVRSSHPAARSLDDRRMLQMARLLVETHVEQFEHEVTV